MNFIGTENLEINLSNQIQSIFSYSIDDYPVYESPVSFPSLPVGFFRPVHSSLALPESDQKRGILNQSLFKNTLKQSFKRFGSEDLVVGLYGNLFLSKFYVSHLLQTIKSYLVLQFITFCFYPVLIQATSVPYVQFSFLRLTNRQIKTYHSPMRSGFTVSS